LIGLPESHTKLTEEHQQTHLAFNLVENTLQQKCLQAGIGFLKRSDNQISASTNKEKYLLQISTRDLVLDADYYKNFNQQLQKVEKQLLVCTDNIVEYESFSNIKFLCHKALIGIKHLHVNTDCYKLLTDHSPTKLFNCFIHRTDSVRQSWLYFLHHYDLLDQGYVSYLLFQLKDYSKLTGVDLYDYVHHNFQLDELEHFCRAYQALRDKVPYQNFKENSILSDKILDSKYSLVLDTYAICDDYNSWFFSEKVARALMLPTCPLLFLQKGTLTKLSNLGLVIAKSNLDIDQLHWQVRQKNLLEILSNDTQEYNFTELKNTALYNHNLLKTFYQTVEQFYDEAIELAKSQFN